MPQINILTVIITALGLSADCFAVALGLCVQGGIPFRKFVRFPVAFGVFQASMMLIGWAAGSSFVRMISAYDHWVALALLIIIGGKMIWESFHEKVEKRTESDNNRWLTLLLLSIATSIDSLAVGLSYAFLKVNIALASGITGAIACVVTVIGYYAGNRLGAMAGRWAEMVGGIILVLIGLRILVEHLF